MATTDDDVNLCTGLFDCLYMTCCGPCAIQRILDKRDDAEDNCGCTPSWLCCLHPCLFEFTQPLSYGWFMARKGRKPSKVLDFDGNGCLEFFCVPCNYANEMQKQPEQLKENIVVDLTHNNDLYNYNSEPKNLLTMER